MPLNQALQVAIEIADALDKAHRQGNTHRDLEPGNIVLTQAGAKLRLGHDLPAGVSAPTLTGEGWVGLKGSMRALDEARVARKLQERPIQADRHGSSNRVCHRQVIDLIGLKNGAGDGDRIRDQRLGKP